MEKMQSKKDFFIEQSKINQEEKYISVPISSSSEHEDYDDLIIILNKISDELKKKYPDINFSGNWDTKYNVDTKKEFVFYFE